jgi:cell division protein FtsQ
MAKRRTSKPVRRKSKTLLIEVSSPRILWFRILGLARRGLRLMLIPAAAALLWGAGLGLQHAFLQHDEFRLALIDLNPNAALDERRLAELGGIDVDGSIFAINVAGLETKLATLPELASAKVERELPGTLRVRVAARVPVAWIELPGHAIAGRDLHRGLLVDAGGVPFPCVPGLVGEAAGLPVVVLSSPQLPAPVPGRPFQANELTRALDLLKLARSVPGIDEFPIERIEQQNEWSFLLQARSGMVARFGLLDQRRQLADYVAACRHARERDYPLATIDLIPERNIPVTFVGSAPPPPAPAEPEPPRAIPVAEEPAPAAGPRPGDPQKMLERESPGAR